MNSQNYAKCTSGMFSGNNMRLQPGSAFSRNKTFDACFFVFVFCICTIFRYTWGVYKSREDAKAGTLEFDRGHV